MARDRVPITPVEPDLKVATEEELEAELARRRRRCEICGNKGAGVRGLIFPGNPHLCDRCVDVMDDRHTNFQTFAGMATIEWKEQDPA